jgi:predicted DNA-binding transcriptional regulator YafY
MYYRENWYLEAWCHTRVALRSFSVDAVRSVELIDTPCHEVPMDVVQQTFGPGYGIFTGDSVQWAQLRFSANRARWVAHEQWHPEQHGDFDNDGRYLLNIPFTDHRELMMDILKYGAECEVLAPFELRQRIADEINSMRNMY